MTEEKLFSHYLQEEMTLKIYQPMSFSPLYKYHICIMHDGDDYYQLGRAATVSDRLHRDGHITNTVFVGIHYIDRYDRLKKYHPDGEQNESYTQFLIREAVPFLDDFLPTLHMGKSRTLMGDSLAGTLSLMTAIRYPHTFGKVIMQSPFVNDTVLKQMQQAGDLSSIDIYHTIGSEETRVTTTRGEKEDFLQTNRELKKYIEQKDIDYIYHELIADHTWKGWQKDLPRALSSMLD